jgi:uncharacterized protein (TIGR02453 family)
MAETTTKFEGFPQGGFAFFHQLAICQDREWFKTHKADYEALWQQPMTALFDELHAGLKPLFPELAKTSPKVFRIYRDVRFSKNKAPFKTSIAGVLPLFGGAPRAEGATGFYCDFSDEPFVAAGRWQMETPLLTRFRKFIDEEKTGAPFAKAVKKLEAVGFGLSSMEALKRPPAGFQADHPRIELLKRKGFALTFPKLDPALLADGRGLVKLLKAQVKQASPLLHWLEAMARGKQLPKL